MRELPASFTEKHRRRLVIIAALVFLCAGALSLLLGASSLTLGQLWDILRTGDRVSPGGRIFFYARLPRTVACLAAGAGLAVAGAILQAVLANPLAAPNIIGVNAGAALGVTLCSAVAVSGWALSISAFAGALIAVSLVVLLGKLTGASRLTVVLAGVAVNALFNAISDTLRTFFPDTVMSAVNFRVGGFSSIVGQRLWPAVGIIAAGLLLAFALSNELDVLSMGETTAHGLGLPVKRYRGLLLCVAALLAGASVSFCGLLGFVGLIVPHLARQMVGTDSRWLIPMSALCGGGLVALCDVAARVVFAPYEVPAGIFLSFIGVPFFLVLLIRQRGGRTHA